MFWNSKARLANTTYLFHVRKKKDLNLNHIELKYANALIQKQQSCGKWSNRLRNVSERLFYSFQFTNYKINTWANHLIHDNHTGTIPNKILINSNKYAGGKKHAANISSEPLLSWLRITDYIT